MGHFMTRYLLFGEKPRRERVRILPEPNMTGNFNDSAGKPFLFQGVLVKDWQPVMTALGCWELLGAAGLGSLEAIAKSKDKEKLLVDVLDRFFATNTREHWLKILRDADVVSGPVNDFAEAARNPNVIANNNIVEVDHPRAGKIRVNGFPWKFSKTPAKAGVAPELGEHTDEIMTRLGYTKAEIQRLRAEKII
jgi:crotonobetainyl-CoA:carnitine CoA-transferase CaiB-like acyl-CoA transferase